MNTCPKRRRKRRKGDFFPVKLAPEVNIGTLGHVDHGKTTLVNALTGLWTDRHSEERKRGITIRLGYADATFYYCEKEKKYANSAKCPSCFGECVPKRAVSFVDSPGHETLMATVLSGTALMDGALLLIAANEKCPKPQTAEHLKALDISGIKNVVIVQNKVDLVSEQRAKESYEEIKRFVKGTVAESAPIIPISAAHGINIDMLMEAIETHIPTPERDKGEPVFYVARSFDINKPGDDYRELRGAVLGGSVVSGSFAVGDEIEITPGAPLAGAWKPLKTKIKGIVKFGERVNKAEPGGLAAIETSLDPALAKSDGLAGNVMSLPGKFSAVSEIKLTPHLFDHVIGISGQEKVPPMRTGDTLMITCAISKTVGVVASAGKEVLVKVKIPVAARKGDRLSLSKHIGGRWHLIGYGIVA
ncbi:MAG: translation initiation factor IF-2 subunit gamma [Candidatus Aenigmarchaeota archaeon]|nr:translation initiation factor IF-2 subunit gamma [Candidatus Aenigmarchaeota archaeon]